MASIATSHPPPPGTPRSTDNRAYLDKTSSRWRYEDDKGEEWEWQPRQSAPLPPSAPEGAWIKVLDEDLIRAQQAAYSVAGVDEAAPAEPVVNRGKKRKNDPDTSAAPNQKPKTITSLFISGLPLDCTDDEIASVFSRYGLLLEDDEGKPRIKMYHDDATGVFRGEALVVYFKPESVNLAINLLDDTHIRAATGQISGPTMKVQRAQFHSSSSDSQPQGATKAQASTSSQPSNSAPKPAVSGSGSRRNLTDQERKKIQKRVARMENKLTDWDSSDQDAPAATSSNAPASSLPRTVVLKKMFTLVELDEDPTLLLDLKQDVREECEGIGKVTNVILWDKEPEGVMTIRFADPQAAQECVKKMDGRYFAGRRIDAFLLEGKPRYRRSDKNGQGDDQEERADAFGDWLESGGP